MSINTSYVRLSTIASAKPIWHWRYYLAGSMLTLLDGDPGVGKSYLAMKIAAEFSRGGLLPGDSKPLKRSRVFYLSGEDDASFTIRPRIEAMGGDTSMVFIQGSFSPFDKKGMQLLKDAVHASPPKLIVVDPLYSFVGADADIYRPNEIRRILAELTEVADYSGAAVLAIRHLRKMKADKAIYQGAGAIDVIAVARCGLLVAEDPDDPSLKIIAHAKHNLSKRMESITYRLVDQGDDEQPRFEWGGPSSLTADQLVGSKNGSNTPRELAKEFLLRVLATGERPAHEIFELAEDDGIATRTLKRAKSDLGVVSRSSKDGWFWKLA